MQHVKAVKKGISIIAFSLTRPVLKYMIYRTRNEQADHYTTDAVWSVQKLIILESNLECAKDLLYKILQTEPKSWMVRPLTYDHESNSYTTDAPWYLSRVLNFFFK